MSFPRRGEIYLVRLPGHPSDIKDRPALVVSLDVRNRLANDVIVVPLSTTLRLAPTHVELPAGREDLKKLQWQSVNRSQLWISLFSSVVPLLEQSTLLLCEKLKKLSNAQSESWLFRGRYLERRRT